MYVIFPLEELLEPHSVSFQRSTNQSEAPQTHHQDNEPASSRPSPSPQPSRKTQPNQETSAAALLPVPEESPSCASVTSDLKRSGSIRSSAAIDPPTALLAEATKIHAPTLAAAAPRQIAGFAKNFLKPPRRLSSEKPSTLIDKNEPSSQTLHRKSSSSPQTDANLDESTKSKRSQTLEKKLKKSNDSTGRKPPKKSHSFSSIAPSYQALHIRRAVTPSDSQIRLRQESVAQETSGRQGSSTSIDKKVSTSGTLSALSSDAASEARQVSYPSVRRGHYNDQPSSASVYRPDSPLPSFSRHRKRAVVNVSVLPKDLGTPQKSAFIGAKDCSISAKEFSHNANASAVTIVEKEYCVQSKSEVGNENKEGFFRKNFFREGGSIGSRQNVIRSESSVDSSVEATVACSSVRSSNSSSTRSRASGSEVGPWVKASDASSGRSKVHLHQPEQPFYRKSLGPFIKTSLDASPAARLGPRDVGIARVARSDSFFGGDEEREDNAAVQSSDAVATSANAKHPAAPVRTLSTGAAPLGLDSHEGGRSPPQRKGSGAVSELMRTAAAGNFSAVAAPSLPPASPPRQLRLPSSGDKQRKSHTELPSKWTPPVGAIRSLSVSPKEKRPPWGTQQLMASDTGDAGLKYLTHPALNDPLKAHTNVTFKLVKTVSDFCAQLARLHEHQGEQLQHLVHSYRKRNSELRNERPTPGGPLTLAWESLLQEVEEDSQLHVDVAATLTRDVARPLVESTFYRKIESRKVFAHRESYEAIISRAEEQLKKQKKEYTDAYRQHCTSEHPHTERGHAVAHNSYLCQLRATNGMLTEYHGTTLPVLLKELEALLVDVGNATASSLTQAVEIVAAKSGEQHLRYQTLCRNCRTVSGRSDASAMVKALNIPNPPRPLYRFGPPHLPPPPLDQDGNPTPQSGVALPTYPAELVLDGPVQDLDRQRRLEELTSEAAELGRLAQLNSEAQAALQRAQQRSLEAGLNNKANELQEDICLKRFDARLAQLQLGAVTAQKELFSPREGAAADGRDRKMSSSSAGGMKSKWMKAFKSLKTSSSSGHPAKDGDRRGGSRSGELSPPILENSHYFQEYTYKKISACDVCHQILKGHSRQGLKCKLCKVNVHPDCQGEAPRCQPKTRLLRRQRSTSEIETKHIEPDEEEMEQVGMGYNSLIASQPGRRPLEPPSPTGLPHHPHDPVTNKRSV